MVRRRSGGWTFSSLPLLLLAGACVTTDEAPTAGMVDATPVVLPLTPVRAERPQDQYFANVLTQMQEALLERDAERLAALLAQHDRGDAPGWAADRMVPFRTASRGLSFAAWAADHAEVSLPTEAPPIGAPLQFTIRVPLPASRSVELDDASFQVSLFLVDYDPYGGRSERSSSRVLALPADGEVGSAHWELPFRAELDAGSSVIREVRVDVELLAGALEIDGDEASLPRMPIAQRRDLLFPVGVEPIRREPLRTLRNALSLGDQAHHPHQYLAAYFTPVEEREEAIELLMPSVRLGDPGQARVAMAALRLLTDDELGLEDRQGWLSWWSQRSASRGK